MGGTIAGSTAGFLKIIQVRKGSQGKEVRETSNEEVHQGRREKH